MRTRFFNWLIPLLLLGAAAYAIAEELTLTTYYPSPRGVYSELRVGSGGPFPTPTGTLHVLKSANDGNAAFRVDDQDSDTEPFLIDQAGSVGIGTDSPGAKLDVRGAIHTTEGVSRTTCPADMRLVGLSGSPTTYCVEFSERAPQTWQAAAATCRNSGRRLCTPEEFVVACDSGAASGMNNNWEFTSSVSPRYTESTGQAWSNQMGGIPGACQAIAVGFIYEPAGNNTPTNFRCCL